MAGGEGRVGRGGSDIGIEQAEPGEGGAEASGDGGKGLAASLGEVDRPQAEGLAAGAGKRRHMG